MRYDTPVYFQKVTQGEYDPITGDYGEDTVDETCVMASVMDTRTETMQVVYGSIKQGSKTIHIQNHYDKSYDSIRLIIRFIEWIILEPLEINIHLSFTRYKMVRSIKITGIKELEAKLKKNATLDDARTVVKKNGAELQTLMTRNAVFVKGYSTGATKRSIRCTFTDLNLTATVEPTTYYSPYPEYGTRFMSPSPL